MKTLRKVLKRIRRFPGWFLKKRTIIGDQQNTDWMDIQQSCKLPFTSWFVLKDGLAILWNDGDWLIMQGRGRIERFVQKGNWHCRTEKHGCAYLTATEKSCYQVMLEAYDKRAPEKP